MQSHGGMCCAQYSFANAAVTTCLPHTPRQQSIQQRPWSCRMYFFLDSVVVSGCPACLHRRSGAARIWNATHRCMLARCHVLPASIAGYLLLCMCALVSVEQSAILFCMSSACSSLYTRAHVRCHRPRTGTVSSMVHQVKYVDGVVRLLVLEVRRLDV